MHMALGAFFSAMEVIPLLLLTFEAWRFMRLGAQAANTSVLHAASSFFPHKWSVMFLHEAPYTMTVPLMVLAVLSAFGGFLGVPYSLGGFLSAHPNLLDNWLDPVFAQSREVLKIAETNEVHMIEYILMAASVVIALIAVYLANRLYSKGDLDKATSIASGVKPVHRLLLNKYYLDEIYFALIINPFMWLSRNILWKVFDAKIIDGLVNGAALVTMKAADYARRIQSGIAQNYAVVMMGGIIIIIAWLLFAI
jgi:NADH-quinone oxidoreductase subunit L